MIPVKARQQGGTVIMSIPSDLVKLYGIKSGDPLTVDVVPGGFITRPVAPAGSRRFTLAELLKDVDRNFMEAVVQDTEWIREGAPVGREIL